MKYRVEYAEEGSAPKTIGHAETIKDARTMASEKIRSVTDGSRYYWCGPKDWPDSDEGWRTVGGYSTKHCEFSTVIYRAENSFN